ncbi:MAG: hypothetical protein ACI4D9_13350 [Lachnospiraceae bacterium]
MSTSYSIYRFAKPTKHELWDIDYFSEYDSFPIYDANGEQTNERIRLFRSTDEETANLINSKFAQGIVLPQEVTDYEELFREMGFNEKEIAEKRVHIKTSDGYTMEYTDGEQIKQIRYDDLNFYQKIIQTECMAVKMECLWNSDDVYCYLDKKRVLEYIPALQEYRFVPVSNSVLAKAEIPFLIFERNKGKCFIEMY